METTATCQPSDYAVLVVEDETLDDDVRLFWHGKENPPSFNGCTPSPVGSSRDWLTKE